MDNLNKDGILVDYFCQFRESRARSPKFNGVLHKKPDILLGDFSISLGINREILLKIVTTHFNHTLNKIGLVYRVSGYFLHISTLVQQMPGVK